MLSPVFSQHAYQGAYEELKPQEVPEDVSFFNLDQSVYPLLYEVKEYIQSAILRKGDCVYVPAFYWLQYVAVWSKNTDNAMFIKFQYETSSKLAELFFSAIHQGVLVEK